MKSRKGIFITFEGIEGSGKSTQVDLFCQFLDDEGIDYVRTVEPGGTEIGDDIRKILLSVEYSEITPLTELLLYAASRAQHIGEIIKPSLQKGLVVVCDRFSDSTLAYQGFGRGLDRKLIELLNSICTDKISPDLTFLLDIDAEQGLDRNKSAQKVDRLELETIDFHKSVREGYLMIAQKEPGRIKVIDARAKREGIEQNIRTIFQDFLKEHTECHSKK